MALILSLETSASMCSVALHEEGTLIRTLEVRENQVHAAKLAVLIQQVFQGTPYKMASLHAVAISAGPGSYTGLRIGTSTAKGICYALNIPLLAIHTLDLLCIQANAVNAEKRWLCPMIDARRMEVYCQVATPDLQIAQPMEAKVIEQASFHELLERQHVLFFGDGAEKCKAVINHPNAFFLDGIFPQASAMGEAAFSKFRKKEWEDLVHFTPLYLKDFIAKKATSFF